MPLIVKFLAITAAAVAAIGAAAAGVTSSLTPAPAQIQPVVFDAPLPLEPPAGEVPPTGEILGILAELGNPAIPTANKSNLIEGGVQGYEAVVADKKLQKAAADGKLPLSFDVANVAPTGPGRASADVTVSGPRMDSRTMTVSFVNQGNWKLSRDSALTIMQAAKAR